MHPRQSSFQQESAAATEFYHRETDNMLRVENTGEGGVLISAAKDNFGSARRRTFVRYLKSEGIVPEDVRLAADDGEPAQVPRKGEVLWVLKPSWPYGASKLNPYSYRLCARLLLGPAIAWLLYMWIMIFR